MIKLVVFDWNGTLLADTAIIYECVNDICKLLNITPIGLTTYRKFFDVPINNFYKAIGFTEAVLNDKNEHFIHTFHQKYELKVAKARSRANARYLLEYLSKRNIPTVIFSNHIKIEVEKQLKRLKLNKYIPEVLANTTKESALNGRNKKEKLRIYLEKNNFLPYEVLIIGDTIEEIEIAHDLKTKVAAITDGHCAISRLRKAKPDFLVSNLKEITYII